MNRRAMPYLVTALALVPASAAGALETNHKAERKQAHDAAEALCKQERTTNGETAFRTTYGSTKPLSVCIRRHLPIVTEVLASCRAEKASLGAAAFQKKWGPHGGALRNCALAGISTTRKTG